VKNKVHNPVGKNKSKPVPQKWFSPERNLELKAERIDTNTYCIHYPEGPERVKRKDMVSENWQHRGEWDGN
jgi:hypothetical protein